MQVEVHGIALSAVTRTCFEHRISLERFGGKAVRSLEVKLLDAAVRICLTDLLPTASGKCVGRRIVQLR